MLKRILPLLLTGLAVWQWQNHRRKRDMEHQLDTCIAKPNEVTTWEGEGGALKGSGSQIGPAPVLP